MLHEADFELEETPIGPSPRAAIAFMTPYSSGRAPGRQGLILDENEGPEPPAAVLRTLQRVAAEAVRRYPDASALTDLIAARHGIDASQVFVTAGADEALDRLCRAYLEPGREAILSSPTFEMLVRYVRLTGAELVQIPWVNGEFPTADVYNHVTSQTTMVAVVSPNNPTGLAAREEDLRAVAAVCPQALVVLDHAYAEYADHDLTDVALSFPNVVVTRTLSKAWGLAGIRVGYTLGPRDVIRAMRSAGAAYPVSALSCALAASRLETDHGELREHVEQVRRERQMLTILLRSLGAVVPDSQANFILARWAIARPMHAALTDRNVFVKLLPPSGPLGPALRIGCPGSESSSRFLRSSILEAHQEVCRHG
ncbi:histidinol-phosphate aminotransferase [Phycisphaerales bacterium]|nr:histidinol-phosphate aminotransferase [Phycisphaerales bacterium]